MTFTAPRPTAARYAGLDGLRAVAVILVVVYHLFGPALLPGGFLGVDVFFVISGFLITSLLLREIAATGGIRLGEFWRRRARRLLPALLVVLAVCTSIAGLIGGDILSGLGWQVLGALTFSYNWLALAGDTGYFAATTTELFRNVWSLAVEEQFYLLWPLILPLFLLLPRRMWRAAAAAILALASATVMAIVVSGGAGTGDDRLLGCRHPRVLRHRHPRVRHPPRRGAGLRAPGPPRPDRRAPRGLATGAGAIAVGGVIALALLSPGDGIATFPGVLLAASALTAVAILVGRGSRIACRRRARRRAAAVDRRPVLRHLPLALAAARPRAGVAARHRSRRRRPRRRRASASSWRPSPPPSSPTVSWRPRSAATASAARRNASAPPSAVRPACAPARWAPSP